MHVCTCTLADAHAHIYPHHTHVSHTVLLTTGGLSVRRTHRKGYWPSVCRPCSAHLTGRMNCRNSGKELAHAHTHAHTHTYKRTHACTQIHTPTLNGPLTCCFPQGQAGLRDRFILYRAQSRRWRRNCSKGE